VSIVRGLGCYLGSQPRSATEPAAARTPPRIACGLRLEGPLSPDNISSLGFNLAFICLRCPTAEPAAGLLYRWRVSL